jgi:hypothetical protein
MPFAAPRAQIASSQLTTYNRIANIGKQTKIQKSTPKATQNIQHMKGKFYQT